MLDKAVAGSPVYRAFLRELMKSIDAQRDPDIASVLSNAAGLLAVRGISEQAIGQVIEESDFHDDLEKEIVSRELWSAYKMAA